MCKLYPSNKNYLVETIGLKLLYIIYGSTTLVIANLICLANIPIRDLTIYHLEQSFTASCFCHWSAGLTKRKLPMQCTISMEVCPKKQGNQVSILLHLPLDQQHTVVIIQLVSLKSYLKPLRVFPKLCVKHSLEFSRFFLQLTSVD